MSDSVGKINQLSYTPAPPSAPLTGQTFVQPAITGYRQLSQAEADLMNEVKGLANQVGSVIERMAAGNFKAEDAASIPDQRWVSIARTQLQQGFMALVRAVAKPTSF